MSQKLYVGNLDFETTEEDLQERFAKAGTVVSAEIIKDRDSGKSRGFGFVEMSSKEEAKKAIELFHQKEFQSRTLTVEEAKPKKDSENENGSDSDSNLETPDLDEEGIPYMR
ncbi:MAG: RNA-binding protein [Patescibacteria group bacterium]|nr:RNA-binding protein [Patescibacteria group bacterium]